MSPTSADVKSIFGRALELEAAGDRAAYLDEVCQGDAGLRTEVENLLATLGRAGDFMCRPAAAAETGRPQPISEGPGTVIGPYKLMEQIGEGGMGLVFVADQAQPVRRRVALKIIKPGMDSAQVSARFEVERQALAMMDHQNIAKVYDAGATASGRPYFVMELVHGIPITEYCDANKLAPRQRLELFVPVCHAIQHAHQKGIIHRDVKPSNILVTMYDDKPVPKVIDFGVAKAIDQRLTERTVYTQFGTLVGTFEYMSPEQAEMNAFGVDTRSDIYSLGVLLYELLTGTTPLEKQRVREAAFDEIRRIIKEEEPQRPSARLSSSGVLAKVAAERQTEPATLTRLVRGELDWVVMKCLEKDRTRRYETANGLARDIERYLNDEPVQACPPSAGYLLRKFARRHKRSLATTALLAVMLLILVGVVAASLAWVARDRTARQADLEHEIHALLDQAKLLRDQGKWADARAATRRAERLAEQGSLDPQERRVRQFATDLNLAEQLEDLSLWRIQGTTRGRDWLEARRTYEAAFRNYGIDLATGDPGVCAERIRDSDIHEQLLAALDDWDWQYVMVELSLSLSSLRIVLTPPRAAKAKQTLADLSPGAAPVPPNRLRMVANLADADPWRKRIRFPDASGARHTRKEVEELASDPAVATPSPATALLLARSLFRVSSFEKSARVLDAAHQRHPDNLRLNYELAWLLRVTSDPMKLEKSAGFIRSALALRPRSPGLHFMLGQHLLSVDNLDPAIAEFRKAIELKRDYADPHYQLGLALARKRAAQGAVDAFTNVIELSEDPAHAHRERGRAHAELGRWDLAAADFERTMQWTSWEPELWCEHAAVLLLIGQHDKYRLLSAGVVDDVTRGNVLTVFAGKGNTARYQYLAARTAVLGGAADDPARIVKLAAKPVAAYPGSAHYLHTLGMAHLRAGDLDQAIRRLRESTDVTPAWPGNVVNWLGLALAFQRQAHAHEARHWLDKAVQWIDQSSEGSSGTTLGLHRHDWLACLVLRREAEGAREIDQRTPVSLRPLPGRRSRRASEGEAKSLRVCALFDVDGAVASDEFRRILVQYPPPDVAW